MKKKQLLSAVLASVMVFSLTACGSSSTESQTDTGTAETETETAAETETTTETAAADTEAVSEEDKVITFWNLGTDEPDKSLWQAAADWYNENESPTSGYTVETVSTTNDQYKEKLSVAMSAGECPDMYIHWTGGPMVEYIKSGYAQDITDLMTDSGTKDKYLDAAINQSTYDGKIYAVPVLNDSVATFFYDKKMWADNGYEVPTTIDELEALCDQMVADGVTPFALANSSQWTGSMYYMYLVARYGGPDIITNAYDGSGSFVNEATQYAGEKIEEWVENGYFPEGVNSLSADDGEDRALLYQGAGMMLQGSWQVGSIKQENPDFYENLASFAFPVLEGSSADQSVVVGTIGDNFVSFNCTGEKLQEAFKVAEYYSSSEWEAQAIEAGKVPPLKDATSEEPTWQDILSIISDASSVQLWWDQYLPSSVADVHKSASQKLFDLSATP
ncbi:MAG TPA: extracellular solute-binding protein, partial [Lachnospiraceae bacterium]|nr:extracellular solute-binding protein [Lachnospiraceae bacterium]